MLFKIYLYVAFAALILNGVFYNIALIEKEIEETYWQATKVFFIFLFISLFWPVQAAYMLKLFLEGKNNGEGNR